MKRKLTHQLAMGLIGGAGCLFLSLPASSQEAAGGEPAAKEKAAEEKAVAEKPAAGDGGAAPAAAKPADAAVPPAGDAGVLPGEQPGGEMPPPIPPVEEKPFPVPAPASSAEGKEIPITRTGGLDSQVVNLRGLTIYADTRRSAKEPPPLGPLILGDGVKIIEGLTTPAPDKLRDDLTRKWISRNKPATFRDLEFIVSEILDHYRAHNRPMTHVYIPKQAYTDKIKIAVVEGKVGNAKVITEADVRGKDPSQLTDVERSFAERMEEKSWWDRWYEDPYTAEKLQKTLQPRMERLQGRVVDTAEIQAQLASFNRSPWARLNEPVEHPFREVNMLFTPPEKYVLGTTDLVFEVEDSRPLRFFVGADNTLTELLGENRLFLGAIWYDAFLLGLDHQLGFQLFSAIDPSELSGASVSYQIPWKNPEWEQFSEAFFAYVDSTAEVPIAGVDSEVGGSSFVMGLRHYLELPELFGATDFSEPLGSRNAKKWAKPEREAFGIHHEVGLGVDFKSSDNDVMFGGVTAAANPADVFQLVVEYNARQTDPTGQTRLSLQGFFSPGGITSNNDDANFAALRFNAPADYFYTRIMLEREQDLPCNFLPHGMMVRAAVTGQYSTDNLLASEQLGYGGYNTIRGFSERAFRGDNGWILNLELYSPPFYPARDWFKAKFDDELKFLLFVDYGYGEPVEDNGGDPLDDDRSMMSAGFGFRYEIGNDLRVRFDWGIPLDDGSLEDESSGFHFGAVWAF